MVTIGLYNRKCQSEILSRLLHHFRMAAREMEGNIMVFYFTGTGNSLYVAKQIEEEPLSIPQVMQTGNSEFTSDSIGIVALI